MKKLLWVGDAGCPSGFARATHETLDALRHSFDVTVLGINYRGDPHPYPYPLYTVFPGGDPMGVGRFLWMCDLVEPDVIVIQQDGWNFPSYVRQLAKAPEHASIPVVAAVAVDGQNFQGRWLEGVALAIFWTQFALDEARLGGYAGAATVIPLGVDLDTYYPIDRYEARSRRLPKQLDDAFIVGNVNRNQPRKRWDLTVKYFAAWVNANKIDNAYLYLHVAPTGDMGCDVVQLARYYGIVDRLILSEPEMWYGVPEHEMRDIYNCFDVQVSTTQGEGFGLTTFEGMACGIPQIVPDWSALGELTKEAALLVPCTSTAIGPPYVNVLGGIADEASFIRKLDAIYASQSVQASLRERGLKRVHEQRFRWPIIGQTFTEAVENVLDPTQDAAWQDLGRPVEVSP